MNEHKEVDNPVAQPEPSPRTTPIPQTPATAPVSRWALHRRIYDWMLSFADHRHSTTALFCFLFAESSFFPVTPDVLLGPLCLGDRKRSMWFGFITTLASVLGAFLGYAIGFYLIDLALKIPGIEMGAADKPEPGTIKWLEGEFATRGDLYVFVAALTPIPFKLLTITAGFAKMNLLTFGLACLIGRGIRFFGVATVFWLIGPKAKPFIDRHFNTLCFVFLALLVGGFFVIKMLG